jgi:hypothetical protein
MHYFHDELLASWLGCAVVSTSYEQAAHVTGPVPAGSRAPQTWPIRDVQGKSKFRADKKELLKLLKLPEARNFFGHGHGTVLVAWPGAPDPDAVGFMGLDVSTLKRKLKHHRYRFVFLDGCQTTGGYDLIRAFGASSMETPSDWSLGSGGDLTLDIGSYTDNLWPGAFVGWHVSIPFVETVGGNKQYLRAQAFCVGQVAANWTYGQGTDPMPLRSAISVAKQDTLYIFGQNLSGLNLGALEMFGYRNLTCTGYNHGGDPRP